MTTTKHTVARRNRIRNCPQMTQINADMKKPDIFLLVLALYFVLCAGSACANPQGMTVVSGSAHAVQQGNVLQVTTSVNAHLQWKSFNIGAGETTVFHQPSASSIVIDQINSANPSAIFGSLRANGIVVLENQSGFYFGPNAFVKAGGLVVTTAAVNPWSSGGGAGWSFDGLPAVTPIVNYGHLETASGGSLFLISKQIENNGTIAAPGGTVALVAGQEVLLSERPDGLSLSVSVQLPAGSVDNQGRIVADAGQVLLQAQTVNNSGVIRANSVREKNGVIELYASDDVQLTGSSVIQANGGAEGISPGGDITIKSGGAFSDSAGSQITATGGANGGNGGTVDVSAPNIVSLNSRIDARAQAGWNEGLFSLDPENIVLGTSGTTGPDSSGTINGTGSSGTLNVNVNTAFQNIKAGQILLEASGNITLNAGTTWDLSASTGNNTGQLTLEAGGNITLGAAGGGSATIKDENNWSVTMEAGYNFAAGSGVVPGVGNVNLAGGYGVTGSAIKTAAGNITVLAGNSVTVGGPGGIVTGIANGAVISGAGGNINVQAVAGNVNTGTSTAGYLFSQTQPGYAVNPGLGGISTASGGNVTIQAGGSISAALPETKSTPSDFGSGAFGAAPGNVTLTAGGNVTGHYVLANGAGTITAGNAGTPGINLALSLITGGWVVNAADNIVLQEVRNPDGMFNNSGTTSKRGVTSSSPFQFLYNYNPQASVVLDAGNNVTITGASLPRTTGNPLEGLVFPPILTIEAGAGGITLQSAVNLFPSAEGTLNLTTTGGGNLYGNSINVSDSTTVQGLNPSSFTSGDPNNDGLLHLDDANPVLVNISGSVSDFTLYSPKPVEMYVTGNLIDSSATIKNLHPTDTSIISVGGEILDHSDYVILTLPPGETPNFNALDQVAAIQLFGQNGVVVGNPNLNPVLANQELSFAYDAASGTLKYNGIMSAAVEQALLAMPVPFLDAATIKTIYTQSQLEAINPDQGYTIAGPGTFQINAASMDLGNGGGIVSQGVENHPALAPYTARGADIDVSVSGNITMLASTIESQFGGEVNVTCGGTITLGSALVPSTSKQYPLGIVSLWQGDISVIAEGDINVDGSRIAAYDGGNLFVESLDGNVNAGVGGLGEVQVTKPNANGKTSLIEQIPGSGILATSFPQLSYGEKSEQIGNITVQTPQGSINASAGGVAQLALGPGVQNAGTINLIAGSKNSDGTVAYVGNVDATGSGVIGGQVNITATGNIDGLVVASQGANVSALQNVNATVMSQGTATVSAGETVSGTVVGAGLVSVSGGKADVAAAFSSGGPVSATGNLGGAAVQAAPTALSTAAAASEIVGAINQVTQPNSDLAANSNGDDEDKNKHRTQLRLREYVGRVEVRLPE